MKKDYRAIERNALAKIKEILPDTWGQEVAKARKEIKQAIARNKFKADAEGTRNGVAYVNTHSNKKHISLALMAAAGIINTENDLFNQHHNLELRSMRIDLELAKLPEASLPPEHKETLKRFYSLKQVKIQKEIDALLTELESIKSKVKYNNKNIAYAPIHRNNGTKGLGAGC